MKPIGGNEPVPGKLLLHAKSELLDVRMFSVVIDMVDTDTEHGAAPREGTGEGRRSGIKHGPRRASNWGCRAVYGCATKEVVACGTIQGGKRQDASIQQKLEQGHLGDDPVVADAVTTAD